MGLVWSRGAGRDCDESLGEGRRSWSLVEQREDNTGIHSGTAAGEIIVLRLYELCVCAHICVSFFVSYTGGAVGDGAVNVSHRFQDVEGYKPDLVEAITDLPPALG